MNSKNIESNTAEELNGFKNEIDIFDYALHVGYGIFKEKDSKRYRALKKNEDLIIVSRLSTGVSWYFNQHNPEDKGTIVDFVKSRQGANLGEARQILRLYLHEHHSIPYPSHRVPKASTPRVESQGRVLSTENLILEKKLVDPSYLYARGISQETLNNQAFIGKIFNSTVVHKETGKSYVNVAFPIYDKTGLISLEQKNKDYQTVLENTAAGQGLWISSNTVGDRSTKLDKLNISESPIDSLSYHQLHQREGENTIYIATVGNVTEAKTNLIQDIIDKRKPGQVILAVDNDLAGSRYRINFLNTLQPPRQFNDTEGQSIAHQRCKAIDFKVTPVGKLKSRIELLINTPDSRTRAATIEQILSEVEKLNKHHKSAFERINKPEQDLPLGETAIQPACIQLHFNHTDHAVAETLAVFLKSINDKLMGIECDFLIIQKPNRKDFNDDLNNR